MLVLLSLAFGSLLTVSQAAGALTQTVVYSLECEDGGLLRHLITETPLGLGNQVIDHCVGDDGTRNAEVVGASPLRVTVRFSADPETHQILDGPVELLATDLSQSFQIFVINGASTVVTDVATSLFTGASGTLSEDVIVWENQSENPYQALVTERQDCFGNATICSLLSPPRGWPFIHIDFPRARPLPKWKLENGDARRAVAFAGDNETPADPTDDLLIRMDTQSTEYETWHGVEIDRFPTGGPDADGDAVPDAEDNCPTVFNPRLGAGTEPPRAPFQTTTGGQLDDDADGYGNACDAKFNTGGEAVGGADLAELYGSFGMDRAAHTCGGSGDQRCAAFDLDNRGQYIGGTDLVRALELYNLPPGPKCAACPLACEGPACP